MAAAQASPPFRAGRGLELSRPIGGLAAFDMDGTLLDGRVIYAVGERFGLTRKIMDVARSAWPPYERSLRIARLLKGLRALELAEVVEGIPIMKGAAETVERLKEMGYAVGIISDSYTLATDIVARRLGMDFHVANVLEEEGGVVTGRLIMPMGWEEAGCTCMQSVCKRFHLARAAEAYGVDPSRTVAVGDSSADLCMLRAAGVGILFNPKELLGGVTRVVHGKDLRLILSHLR